MSAITFILIAVIVFLLLHRKPSPSPIIKECPYLKKELEELKQSYNKTLQQLGDITSQLRVERSSSVQKGSIILELQQDCVNQKNSYDKLLSQKKSSEVRTGNFVEVLVPISDAFPFDPKSMRFLGSPIDYVSFDYENMEIRFVEVKSGQSQLNDNQRKVKKIVESGNVKFVEVRLNEQGIKVK